MSTSIEVQVSGKGSVKGQEVHADANLVATCGVCSKQVDLVVSITPELFSCRDCLRARLDATSVASWRLSQGDHTGLPWGKVAG